MEELVVQMPSGRYLIISQNDAYEIVSNMGGGCKPENLMGVVRKTVTAMYENARKKLVITK